MATTAPNEPLQEDKYDDEDELWYLHYYEAPPYLKAPSFLLRLPNELLALIGARIANNNDLRSLSLACKRFREVAQRSLLRPVRLPKYGIPKLLKMLFDRADLADGVTHIDLGDYKAEWSLPKWDEPTTEKCESLLIERIGHGQTQALMAASHATDGWGERRSFYLAILWALLPKLKRMTVEIPAVTTVPETVLATHLVLMSLFQDADPTFLFQGHLARFLEAKLQSLTISEPSSWKGSLRRNITVANFSLLRYLSLPIYTLVRKSGQVNELDQVLPAGLEELSIRSCNRFTFDVLDAVNASRDHLGRLHQVNLYFKTCVRTSLLLVCLGVQERSQAMRTLLQTMDDQGTSIRGFCRKVEGKVPEEDRYVAADLLEELEAWSYLSLPEIIMASQTDLRFSEIAARTEDNLLRCRHKAERVLFLRTYDILGRVLTSPTFKPELWLKTRFFFGPKKDKWGNNVKVVKQVGEKKKKADEKITEANNDKGIQEVAAKTHQKTRSERSASPPQRSRRTLPRRRGAMLSTRRTETRTSPSDTATIDTANIFAIQ